MTAHRLNESEVPAPRTTNPDAVTLPPDARIPAELAPKHDTDRGGSELDHMAARLGELSDALHDPKGLVRRLFKTVEENAAARHAELMTALKHLANGQVDLSARLAKLEPTVERHDATLKLVHLGNGAAEPGE